jgi:3-methyl-2-oxobutanoate hydroxymethyltransferase
MKEAKNKISMLTAYDFSFARILMPLVLMFYWYGIVQLMSVAGHETTLPITLIK